MSALLDVRGLDKRFGGLHVTRSVSLALAPGDRVALIGPNGAGKTTLVNLVSGALRASAGTIRLGDRDLTPLGQAERVRAGLARTFQITTLAATLPVQHQVEMALHQRYGIAGRMWRSIDTLPAIRREALALLESLHLAPVATRPPTALAYGEQRLVELALALALAPRVLLLDEPMAGVPRSEGRTVLAALDRLPPALAVLIIEHDMDLVFRFARRIVVLSEGEVIADGPPEQIRRDPAVRAVYLGNADAAA
ncbi:MAG: ATP-binding cassette domain-containing protein [Burkholderiaceae bacterium]